MLGPSYGLQRKPLDVLLVKGGGVVGHKKGSMSGVLTGWAQGVYASDFRGWVGGESLSTKMGGREGRMGEEEASKDTRSARHMQTRRRG
eukprot:755662-Hanusia_phi.AAC.2